jgi:hypothetical protein
MTKRMTNRMTKRMTNRITNPMKAVTVVWLGAAAMCAGCLTGPAGRIEVPSDLMRSRTAGDGANMRSRYIVRVTDGDNDWEFEFPEIATAYEVRVPLRGKPGPGGMGVEQATLTAADKEIVGQREVDARARGDEQSHLEDFDAPAADANGGPRPPRPRPINAGPAQPVPTPRASYLLTLAKVKDLYRTRNYEIALVELVALEREYPNDERIMSMKGSLYDKLGRRQLARESWEAVLVINPYNLQVTEALQRLGK